MNTQPNTETIFLDAVEIESMEQREEFLRKTCGDDSVLMRNVKRLLDAHDRDGTILDSLPSSNLSSHNEIVGHPIGSKIGNYKLLQQIGEGGFGVVYMAEQFDPVQRKVALKIVKPGMDSKQVVTRFEVERQALSLMDHPNIARVLDGGATENGRPYFVMDLVLGVPLTEYCDKNRLPIDDLLRLFVEVCSAVQHAHHKGIIHRDLKPSNVMVTLHDGNPVPKVIDFGVAKALNQKLTEKTLFTQYGQMIGTPAYMSPEQAEMSGLDIDTRSDIYSLGVLLYELLTGATPFDGHRLQTAGYAEMQRIITQEEPIRPSTRLSTESKDQKIVSKRGATDLRNLRKSVSGELDWIVMKALEKDRKRRYESASSMASDVQRFLNGEQVEACPPTIAYRMSKLVKRNRTAIGFALGASFLMIATTIICFLLAVKAQNAEALALDRLEQSEQARAESEKVARFLIDLIESVDPRHSHEPVTAIGLLKQAEARLDNLDHHPELKANLQRKLASAYRSLGDHHSGCDLQRQVLDYWLAHYGWEKDKTFHTSFNMVRFYVNTDQYDEALELSKLTLQEALRKFGDAHPLTAFAKQEFARAMIEKGRTAEAVELLESVLRYQVNEFGEADRQVAGTMVTLARAYGMHGRTEDALAMREKAVKAYVSIYGVTDPATLRVQQLFANSLVAARDYDRAIPLLEQLSLQCQSVLGEGHDLALGVQQTLRRARAESEREAKNNGQQLKTPFDENP